MSKTTIPTTGSWVGYRPPQSGPVPVFSALFGAPGDAGAEVRVSVGELIGLSEQIRYIAGRLGRRRFQYCGQLVPPTDFRASLVPCQGELEFLVAAFTPEGYRQAVTAARRGRAAA